MILYFLFALPAMIFALWAQYKVKSTFTRYSKVWNMHGLGGLDVARALMRNEGLDHLQVNQVPGDLTDFYNPADRSINLSQGSTATPSVAAMAIVAHELGHAQQAYEDLNKAIAVDPQDAIAYNQRGIASFAAGNVQAALKDFSKTIELQPQLAEAYNNRAISARTLGDYRQASKDFERAVQLGMELAQQHLQVLRDEARQVQERLRRAGYNPGAVDGVPGPQTVAALRQYQTAQGLAVTGLLDEATRKALGLVSEADARQSGETPRFVYQPTPAYPEEARQQGWEGTVTLHLELRADGTVGDVQVARSSGHAILDTAAQETAKTWKHTPVSPEEGQATRWAEINLTFKLDK